MADARLTLAFDTAGALASLTSFMGKAKAILQTPITPSAGVGTAKGLTDAFGNLQQAKTGLDGFAKSLGSTVLGFAGITGGVAAFHQLTSAISAATDAQIQMNSALKSFDVEPVAGALAGVNAELDRMVALEAKTRDFKTGTTLTRSAAAALLIWQKAGETITGQRPEEDAVRARARLQANIAFQEGQKQRQLLARRGETQLESLQFQQADLLARKDLPAAEANAKAIEAAQAAALKDAKDRLKSEQDIRKARAIEAGAEAPALAAMEVTFKEELLALEEDLNKSAQRRNQTNRRGLEDLRQESVETANLRDQLERDRTTQEAAAESADQEREGRRRRLHLDTMGQLREAERGLAQEIAAAQGRILNDIAETNAARRQQTIETARAEIEGLQAATTGQLQALGGRQAAAQAQLDILPSGEQFEKRRLELTGQMQEIQAQITEAARKGAADRAAVEIKAAADLRALAIREAGERLALLQKTLQQENQLRSEARSLLGQALSNLGTRPGQLPTDEFTTTTLAELEQQTARQQVEDQKLLQQARLNRRINVQQFQGALGRLPFQEQLKQFGGLGAALGIAGTTPGAVPGQLTGAEQFKQAQDQIVILSKQVSDDIAGIKGSFADTLSQVPPLMQKTMDEMVAIVEAGKSKLGASLTDMVQGQLTRAFADAARRM
jgi:hypothetical protein